MCILKFIRNEDFFSKFLLILMLCDNSVDLNMINE